MGTKFDGDRLSRGTKLVGDHLSMGTKFLGTICPWGLELGDRKSRDQMGLGPNESQPTFGEFHCIVFIDRCRCRLQIESWIHSNLDMNIF